MTSGIDRLKSTTPLRLSAFFIVGCGALMNTCALAFHRFLKRMQLDQAKETTALLALQLAQSFVTTRGEKRRPDICSRGSTVPL